MSALTDAQLRDLVERDPVAGWRAFVDQYTPTLLSLIERAGITDHAEATELYLRACAQLSADDCAWLRAHDPASRPLDARLSVLMRSVVTEWVRSRAGRRRLFSVLQAFSPVQQQVFDLFYWRDRTPAEISGILTVTTGRPVSLVAVIDALNAIDRALHERHRRELMAVAARSRPLPSDDAQVSTGSGAGAATRAFDAALAALPPEDAAIMRMKYVQGLTVRDVQRALHLESLADHRVDAIAATFRAGLAGSLE